MIPVLLTKIKTGDGVTLDGIYIKPKQKGNTALIWLHGLGSKFYSSQTLLKELSDTCLKKGIDYFKFNTRGHDLANWEKVTKTGFGGASFEKFEDCIHDIRAIIRFAKKLGYKNIVLAGHSTGANKALYYLYKTRDKIVKSLILLGPLSDHPAMIKQIGRIRLKKALAIAKKLNRKNPLLLMPQEYGVYTARRYLSLYYPGTNEDVFPYHNLKAGWKELKSVKQPVAVIIGSSDEHLDRPAKKFIDIFRKNAKSTKSFYGIIIKGVNHNFRGKEKELTREIMRFIRTH